MVTVNIITDQLTLGKAGISRDDLVLNEKITLRNNDNTNINYLFDSVNSKSRKLVVNYCYNLRRFIVELM